VEELAGAAARLDVPVHAASDLREALRYAEAVTPVGGVIVATGSVFLVGEIRALALSEAR
ncbi:MAG: bifunctional folylpolyglutamate synthase/dihydrofolate synthase, partial [Acidobacteriaceae bacterium]